MWYDDKIAALSAEGVELTESDINLMKKYTTETQFNKAAFHAFRRASGAISLPSGDDSEKRQATLQILRKLGSDKEAYSLKIPDGYPEDARPSDEDIEKFKQNAYDNGLLPFQVQARFSEALDQMKSAYDEKVTKQQESDNNRKKSIEDYKNVLTNEHGEGYDDYVQSVRCAMEKYEYGSDLFDDQKNPTDKFFEMGDNLKTWNKIAADQSESGFVPGDQPGSQDKGEPDYSKMFPKSGLSPDGQFAT